MFFLDEIHVRGVNIREYNIWVGKVREIIPKDNLRVLEEGPKTTGMAVQVDPK